MGGWDWLITACTHSWSGLTNLWHILFHISTINLITIITNIVEYWPSTAWQKIFFACYATSVDTSWVRWVIFRRPTICLCEYVRSIINFHPRNQDVDFDMFGWIQNFSKRDVIALKIQYVYSALLWHTLYCCVIQQLVTSDGSAGTQNDPGLSDNEWGWLFRCLWGP